MAAFAPPMLTREQAVEIRVLARRGMGLREIARQTGLSRNTVRRYLRRPEVDRYGPRVPRPAKLDPFKVYVEERIEAAKPRWIPATVLLRELQERGYEGGISQLKAFIAPKKQKEPEPVIRFETEPGVQMQADFTVIRRGREALLAFVATLGFSRVTFVRFTAGEDAASLCSCLRQAFEFFGGVPQHVLFDNTKTVVIERDAYGDGLHRWHKDLLGLADTYGFAPRLCQPYRAKTKGKVERFNGYLKGSFLVPLAASLKQAGLRLDVEVANAHVDRWLSEVANVRVHGTTDERPVDRLLVERDQLMPLPPQSIVTVPTQRSALPVPVESLQHPLSLYDELLEVTA
jgi:transposase